uniref:Uncharacterized protein n=1 Tax=Rhodopseudomonas palustris (strain BisA53) TaxID=316055 RepID=Q07SJ5_RHOP5
MTLTTKEWLAAIPDTSIPGRRVARELTALIERRGQPDIGTDFTCNAMLTRSEDHRIEWHFIARASRCRTASAGASTARCAIGTFTKHSI